MVSSPVSLVRNVRPKPVHSTVSVSVSRLWMTALVLGVIGAVIYTPLVKLPFLADDYPHLISLIHPSWMPPGQRVFSLSATQFRPLEFLVLRSFYRIFGFTPESIHICYMILHAAVIIEMFFLIQLLTRKYGLATLTMALFVLYPRNIEAVMWIGAAENEVLMSLFLVACCICWILFRKSDKRMFQIISILFFVLGLLTKESAGPFPAVLLVLDLYLKGELTVSGGSWAHRVLRAATQSMRDLWLLFALIVIYGVFAVYHLHIAYNSAEHSAYGFVGIPRLIHYIFEYPIMGLIPFATHNWTVSLKHFLPVSIPVFIVLGSFLLSRKQVRTLGVLWFVLLCLPTLLLSPFTVADLYFYLPILGLCLCVADSILNIKHAFLKLATAGGTIAFVAILTALGISEWKSDISTFDNVEHKMISVAEAHSTGTIMISNLAQIDKSYPLFMNAATDLILFYVPTFKGKVDVTYSDFGDGVTSIAWRK